jgi:hypothetical protein
MTPKALLHGAKDAKFGEIGKYLSLRSWRLGAIRKRNRIRTFSRKGAKDAKVESEKKIFAVLASWREKL